MEPLTKLRIILEAGECIWLVSLRIRRETFLLGEAVLVKESSPEEGGREGGREGREGGRGGEGGREGREEGAAPKTHI